MGFFKNLFSAQELEIGAPLAGRVSELKEVSDPTFREGMLGSGIAILPTGNQVLAPCDATVRTMFVTGHAVSLVTDCGAEVLIHVGLETVNLKGKHFTAHCKDGEKVKKGQLLIEFDREAILANGYDLITPVVICNTNEYSKVISYAGKTVEPGEKVIGLVK